MSTFQAESEYELENELEGELEGELGARRPTEQFFNHLAAMADRGGKSQALRRVAIRAAREALRGAVARQPTIEGELEHELEFELEHELEFELALPTERLLELEAELEHLSHAAAEASSEQEAAEQFLPLLPLAAKLAMPLVGRALPGAARALARAAPRVLRRLAPSLHRGVRRLTRTLYRNPSTRPLMRAIPRIARTTIQSIGTRLANGQRITPLLAAQILARQTARTLGRPRALHRTYRRSVAADRRYHGHHGGGRQIVANTGCGVVRPVPRVRRRILNVCSQCGSQL